MAGGVDDACHMLTLIPRDVTPYPLLLDALGNPSAATVARALGVAESTAYRWQAQADAPRVTRLALYWLTPWGWSAHEADALNRLRAAEQLTRALQRERDQLAALLDAVDHGGGAANRARFVA